MTSRSSSNSESSLPCVVQIGFAGSRRLYPSEISSSDENRFNIELEKHLKNALEEARTRLSLSKNHFFCGVSQVACGADMIFSRVCQNSNPHSIPQRFLLPQEPEEYFEAIGSKGPDFNDEQKIEAKRILEAENVIQIGVVSHAMNRNDRFREVNSEIARISDFVICMFREDATGSTGGTHELLKRAQQVEIPALEILVKVSSDGNVTFHNVWHISPDYKPPTIPEPINQVDFAMPSNELPGIEEYCLPLKEVVSFKARVQQRLFKYAAWLIISAHILATLFATGALALHGHSPHSESHSPVSVQHEPKADSSHPAPIVAEGNSAATESDHHSIESSGSEWFIPWLLGAELLMLAIGLGFHQYLHHSEAAKIWANSRVVAELARSIRSIYPHHIYLEYLFRLSLPLRFRPLLRTLSVLFLRSTFARRNEDWETHREKYLSKRIVEQMLFYNRNLDADKLRLKIYHWTFLIFSSFALIATGVKLSVTLFFAGTDLGSLPQILGSFAIIFPVFAVAGLSWVAALDCEARVETFAETLEFVERHKHFLRTADSKAEFDRLLIQSEYVLLGEVSNWFSRRANTGVT